MRPLPRRQHAFRRGALPQLSRMFNLTPLLMIVCDAAGLRASMQVESIVSVAGPLHINLRGGRHHAGSFRRENETARLAGAQRGH